MTEMNPDSEHNNEVAANLEVAAADDTAQASKATADTDSASGDGSAPTFQALTDSYERLRHSTDSAELSEFAHRPLPPKSDQSAFSRATALLEAVAGNANTPLEDRIFLGETMPFPNILVKLSEDGSPQVRGAVAGNKDDKNWLVGRLTKDADASVRDAALHNPQASWKMRLEGAQNEHTSVDTLDFLAQMGVQSDEGAPAVLTAMVRRAVAVNPSTSEGTLRRLSTDDNREVAAAAKAHLNS